MRYSAPAPEEIERKSFEIIRQLLPDLPDDDRETPILLRIVHTAGDVDIARHVKMHPLAIEAGLAAIRGGARILTDVRMVAAGINASLAERYGCSVRCAIDSPDVPALARKLGCTRSAAAIRVLGDQLDESVVAIGNAPTALFALLDLVDVDGRRPALIVGTPVGFVGAAEAKAELMKRSIPYITVEGTRGGSAVCASAINALLKLGV